MLIIEFPVGKHATDRIKIAKQREGKGWEPKLAMVIQTASLKKGPLGQSLE